MHLPGFNVPGGGGAIIGAPSSNQETARRHRWKFEIEPYRGGAGGYEGGSATIEIYAHKATRPSPEIDVATIHHSQDEIYTPGKNRWLPIEISFYEIIKEDVGNLTAYYIYKWWARDVIQLDKSRIAGRSSFPIKRTCRLSMLDGVGKTIHSYILFGCWPEKVTPEDLNHDESAICEISVRLRYDKAVELPVSAPVASAGAGFPGPGGGGDYSRHPSLRS